MAGARFAVAVVTSTRAAWSSRAGTTKHRMCLCASAWNPWWLKIWRTSASTSKRRPRTNQSSVSGMSEVSWSRSAPGWARGTTTVRPSASRHRTGVRRWASAAGSSADDDASREAAAETKDPRGRRAGSGRPALGPDVASGGSTRATNAPWSGTSAPFTLGSSAGSTANTSIGDPSRMSSTNSRVVSTSGHSRSNAIVPPARAARDRSETFVVARAATSRARIPRREWILRQDGA